MGMKNVEKYTRQYFMPPVDCMDWAKRIPGFFSLLMPCQLVEEGQDSIWKNGFPFRERIRSWHMALSLATAISFAFPQVG